MLSNTLCSMLLIACGTLALGILVVEAGTLPTRSPVEKLDERLETLPAIFKMSEKTVAMEDKHQCMEKLVCLFEKSLPESVHNSIAYVSKYLTNKDHDLDDETYAKVKLLLRSYPRLEHLVDASNLANSHDGPEICSEAYPECTAPANVLMAVARAFDDDSIERSIVSEGEKSGDRVKRNADDEEACRYLGVGCGTYSIGCTICMAFTGGWCGIACLPFSGLHCISHAAAC